MRVRSTASLLRPDFYEGTRKDGKRKEGRALRGQKEKRKLRNLLGQERVAKSEMH